ncbi:hypothetical protein [Gillisia sp. CAL575]|uniref:hypothetical protein n=1 Tax=Gillisia sp. CAL575 TaxID=985255 RepID=UPI0003A2FDAC|nr:hypothetical protein [Gillisia sp. CAL575]
MKNIIFLLVLIIIVTASCNYSNEEKINLENQITTERNKADSLQKIIDTLRTKFIFDNLTILHVPNRNQPIEDGKKYTGKIYFVAFNKEDRILFSDKLVFKNPDTISKIDYGGFEYKTVGKKGENNFYFKALINNSTSLNSRTGTFDGIQMSDKIISE